jgi:hypothetical protein
MRPRAELIVCTPKMLPRNAWIAAADHAIRINPANRPMVERLPMVGLGAGPTKESIAVMTTKYWHGGGVDLTVAFLDAPPADVRRRILSHMNAWAKTANVRFRETSKTGQVRIARAADGYWSYLGTDIAQIPDDQPTMNLEAFTMQTPESEYHRVVRHETGHTLGCPHEHMRRELVARIDPQKAYDFFLRTQGWDRHMVDAQVLTPLEQSSILGTMHADDQSIMCYQIPGVITKDGQPIIGGSDIDKSDYAFMATIYQKQSVSGRKKPAKAARRGRTTKGTRRAGAKATKRAMRGHVASP